MKKLLPLFILLTALIESTMAETWRADPADDLQVSVQETVAAFLQDRPELDEYLQQASGYAVFPRVFKIGAMWGGAWGRGLVIEDDRLVGRCSQLLGSLGAQLGAQSYRQIILFRTQEALEAFKAGRVEFEGRASAVAARRGAATDPAHLPDVAIFSSTNGGLMLEVAAGGVKYGYKPVTAD
jgi:lipid-binding SYLF domain-containing protein